MKTAGSGESIFVGLSGGVDSAVSAALLQEQGCAVTGVFIRTWHPEGFLCTEGEDEREALRVATHLDIPFLTLDLSNRYEEDVAKHFIEGYKRGETPNPDVLCNREVKFGGFIEFAKKRGAKGIATGHYAQLQNDSSGVHVLRATDIKKDQSYFLSLVPKEQLAFARFPVGGMTKEQVRKEAIRFNLPNALRKDSQGICFLGDIDLFQFLGHFITLQNGEVLSESGKVIGSHHGAQIYTLGQRHGFTIFHESVSDEPLFVSGTDVVKNTITVSPKSKIVGKNEFVLRMVNTFEPLDKSSYTGTVRYHGAQREVEVNTGKDSVSVQFSSPVIAAVGQTLALYDENTLVAGGILANA